MFSLILATDSQGGIGKEGGIPWLNREDLRMFKRKTLGHVVIMGRATWESLPVHPLPERMNVILSSTLDINDENVKTCSNLSECIRYLEKFHFDKEWFIIGGGQVYNQVLKMEQLFDKIYLTRVNHDFDCDVKVDLSCLRHKKGKGDDQTDFRLTLKSDYQWTYREYSF